MNPGLVITSDDFGACYSVNTAIIEAMKNDHISATNFMVPTPWFAHAIRSAQEQKFESGIHLTLTCEWENIRWGSISGQRILEDARGHFFQSYEELYARINNSSEITDFIAAIRNEYRAQIECVLHADFSPTHLDSHMQGPMFYDENQKPATLLDEIRFAWLAMVKELSEEYKIPYLYGTDGKQHSYYTDSMGISTLDSIDPLIDWLNNFQEDGLYNITCHVAHESDELHHITNPNNEQLYPWAAKYRLRDYERLRSDKFKAAINRNNIDVISVSELLRRQ